MDKKQIKALLDTLERFRELDPFMQLSTIMTLLEIAKADLSDEEISVKDLEVKLDLKSGTASRNTSYWAEGNNAMVGKYEYITINRNKADRRLLELKLTHKGTRFHNKVFGE